MLKLKAADIFDVNILGLVFIFIVAVILVFFPLDLILMIVFEVCLFSFGYYLYSRINRNDALCVFINSENQWFIEYDKQLISVTLKDYWVFSSRIFIWLKGEKYSVSFVVTRSIIGAHYFSQLHAKIL